MICVVLKWPPSTNSLWRAVKGRNILSAQARRWAKEASQDLTIQGAKPISGPVDVYIELHSPFGNRSYDPDNRVKSILDILVKNGLIENDTNRIVRRFAAEVVTNSAGFVGARVTVTSYGQAEDSEERDIKASPDNT